MANEYFRFQHFTVHQSQCAMKVGTDGTLLGAWANGGKHILDIGTGTGLVALMMAQRFPTAQITGIDIDEKACEQARLNVAESPFTNINIRHLNAIDMQGSFDAIVCNPPFFHFSLQCPDERRNQARHTVMLTYRQLMTVVARLLCEKGQFSAVIPADCKEQFEAEALLAGLSLARRCAIHTTPRKPVRRYLLAFGKHAMGEVEQTEGVIEEMPGIRSVWYADLTKDFYL